MSAGWAQRTLVPPDEILEECVSRHHLADLTRNTGPSERDCESRAPVCLINEAVLELHWALNPHLLDDAQNLVPIEFLNIDTNRVLKRSAYGGYLTRPGHGHDTEVGVHLHPKTPDLRDATLSSEVRVVDHDAFRAHWPGLHPAGPPLLGPHQRDTSPPDAN